jgi:hypothetical protein
VGLMMLLLPWVRPSVLDPILETNSVGSHVEEVSSLSFLLVVLLSCLLRLRPIIFMSCWV